MRFPNLHATLCLATLHFALGACGGGGGGARPYRPPVAATRSPSSTSGCRRKRC
ncbi:MAG: hypothetical protein RL112_892 [Planctomycetota bacterium]